MKQHERTQLIGEVARVMESARERAQYEVVASFWGELPREPGWEPFGNHAHGVWWRRLLPNGQTPRPFEGLAAVVFGRETFGEQASAKLQHQGGSTAWYDEPTQIVPLTLPSEPATVYVCGFAFADWEDDPQAAQVVALIRKKRGPPAIVGKLNGIGGKVEDGEAPVEAMAREWLEETETEIPAALWTERVVLDGPQDGGWRVHFFIAHTDCDTQKQAMQSKHDEQIGIYPISALPGEVVPNLRYLIPMCLHGDLRQVQYLTERA